MTAQSLVSQVLKEEVALYKTLFLVVLPDNEDPNLCRSKSLRSELVFGAVLVRLSEKTGEFFELLKKSLVTTISPYKRIDGESLLFMVRILSYHYESLQNTSITSSVIFCR